MNPSSLGDGLPIASEGAACGEVSEVNEAVGFYSAQGAKWVHIYAIPGEPRQGGAVPRVLVVWEGAQLRRSWSDPGAAPRTYDELAQQLREIIYYDRDRDAVCPVCKRKAREWLA